MRYAALAVAVAVLLACGAEAKRRGGGGFSTSRRGGGSSSGKTHTPAPPPPRTPAPHTHHGGGSGTFLDAERGSSGSTHYRPNPFNPSAPQPPQPKPGGPIGFEGLGGGGSTNQANNHKIGFDKVNSEVQNKPGSGSHTPYPAGSPPYGPPPSYPGTSTHTGGFNDHPPAYPGRPVNAPPTYQANPGQFGQPNPPQPGFHPYPSQPGFHPNSPQPGYNGQYNPYSGQSYPGQYTHGNPYFGNGYSQNNQFGNTGGFGAYPGNSAYYPGYGGNSFGGGSPFGNSYGSHYGGSPFGGGYNGNPYYSPNNFGYSGYPGQYNQQKSRFGGLPIPIPIPIPIPLGGGGFGGLFGNSHSHPSLLDRFVKNYKNDSATDNSTNVFILNNSTVVPCTTDHFVYDLVRVTVLSCTAEQCSAFKITTTTTNTSKPVVHSASITMCLENNATATSHGQNVVAYISPMKQENMTLCRDVPVPSNVTGNVANETAKSGANATTVTPVEPTTTEVGEVMTTTVADLTTTETPTTTVTPAVASNVTTANTTANVTKVCEDLQCYRTKMCIQAIEVVDKCNTVDCPFRRTGYKPCVTVKMCRSNVTGLVSTLASLNTTISKIDEFDRHNSIFDAANLTLITYHRPVLSFNCSQNVTAPGCFPAPVTLSPVNSTTTKPS